MFESSKSRGEFLMALRGGRISAQVLQKAMAETAAFADATVADLSWSFGHDNVDYKKFATAVLAVSTEENRVARLMDLFLKERRPAAEADLSVAIAACGPGPVLAELSKMVNNKNLEVRKKALVLILAQQNWFQHRNLVMTLLADPKPEISEATLLQVVRKAPAAYVGQLRRLATHKKPEIRALSLNCLAAMNDMANAELFLQRMPLEGGDLRKTLYTAIVTFIKADTSAMTARIAATLSDTVAEVRGAGMSLLLKMPDQVATLKAILNYCSSVSAMMRDGVFAELAKQPDAFVDGVLAIFKAEKDPALRLQAMNLAKLLQHQRLAPIFLHEMKNADWLVRYTAMQVLGDMKSPQAVPVLVEQLNNPEASVAAIQALAKYKDMRLAKPFLQKMSMGNESEQLELLKALEGLGDNRLLPHLAKILDSPAAKGKARKASAETIIRMCEAAGTQVPARVLQINDSLAEKTVDDLPDLGLKLSGG